MKNDPTVSPTRLIITADDFGASSRVNEEVERLYNAGLITQAGLMMNGAAAEEALRVAKRCPKLLVGLHWEICRDHPARNGLAIAASKLRRSAVQAAFEEQLQKYKAAVHEIGQLDGHMHLHLHPMLSASLLRAASDHRFPAVRLLTTLDSKNLISQTFSALSQRLVPHLKASRVRFASRVFGFAQSGHMSFQRIQNAIRRCAQTADKPEGSICEIYFHPGAEAEEIETPAALQLVQEIRGSGLEMGNWRDI